VLPLGHFQRAADITSPQALALRVEPQANVGRYDRLRDRGGASCSMKPWSRC
jgi:hypothetical protein